MEVLARGNYIIKRVDGKRNLLDWQATWREGSLPAGWSLNGVAAENSIVENTNPFATKAIMWKCTPDSHGGASGGFTTSSYTLDDIHTYRFTVFARIDKVISLPKEILLGCFNVDNLTGGANTNPYFIVYAPDHTEWCLLVGHIHPSKADNTWKLSTSGIYNMAGKKIGTANDFKLRNPNIPVQLRTWLYNCTLPEESTYFYNPRLEVCDGNEMSIEQLLQVSTREEIDAVKVEYKSEIQKLDNKIAFSVSEVKTYTDNTVNNVKIGVRNYFRNSIILNSPSNQSGNFNIEIPPTTGPFTISAFIKATPEDIAANPRLTLVLKKGETVVASKAVFYPSDYKTRGEFFLSVTASSDTEFDHLYGWIFDYGSGVTPNRHIQARNIMLSKGCNIVDWTPAPEDMETDAQAKADAAQAAAEAVAVAKANLAKTESQAYADGKVTAEERRAIADAQAKLNEAKADAATKANAAQTAATAAAAADATTKANAAQSSAINDAATKYTTKTEHSSAITLLSNQIEQRVTKTVFDNAISDAQLLAKAMSRGLMLYDDPTFKKGLNSIRAYNNTASGSVVVTREQVDGIPNDSGYGLKIQTINGNSTPDLGGFYFGTATKANKVMVCRFVAKVPENQRITFASNAYGAGGSISKWLTSNAGTGKWEEYAYYVKCGETGNFSSTFFFYLNRLADQTYPVTWYLAYATVYDLNANEVFTPRAEYEAKITVLENSITSKVSQGTFDALGNRVSSAESSITQQATQIASKVSQLTFDALGNRVTAAESSITQMPNKISLAVKEGVDGVQIGGRNLLLNSKVTKSSTSYHIGYWNSSRDFVVGETLTVTIKGDIPGSKLFGIWFNSGSLGAYSIYKVANGLYSRVITVPVGTTIRTIGIFLVGNQSGTDAWSFEWIKLESGNKATDWTPAPEDVEADAQAKANAAQAAAEAVAVAKANLAKTESQAYADGKVTAEERRAIADAQAKLNEAKADAQAKANAAQQEVLNKINETGINIENKKITLTSDNTIFKTNSGKLVAIFNDQGLILDEGGVIGKFKIKDGKIVNYNGLDEALLEIDAGKMRMWSNLTGNSVSLSSKLGEPLLDLISESETALRIDGNDAIFSSGINHEFKSQKWNTPGVLASGEYSDGYFTTWDQSCVSLVFKRTGIGEYQIAHNLGTRNYFVSLTQCLSDPGEWYDVSPCDLIYLKTDTYISIKSKKGGYPADCEFSFVIVGNNRNINIHH